MIQGKSQNPSLISENSVLAVFFKKPLSCTIHYPYQYYQYGVLIVGEGHTQRSVSFMTKPHLGNLHHGQAIGNAVFEKREPPGVSSPGPSPNWGDALPLS